MRLSPNIGRHAAGTSPPAMLLLLCSLAWGHGEHEVPRYVAVQGKDTGDCERVVRPCRTIQYAQSVAAKGDRLLVAAGAYEVRTAQDLFVLTSGMLDVQGGFDRFDHFARQAPDANQTTLVGVPVEFRQQLRDRGFHVVVDRKGLRPRQREALAEFRSGYAAMHASSGRVACSNGSDGKAGEFACSQVDLLSHVALADLQVEPATANDIWGFVDLNTEREYALLGLNIGLAVIDVTDPGNPFQAGQVPGMNSIWRDVKMLQVYEEDTERWKSFGYVSTEAADRIMVIDLTGLPNRVSLAGRTTDNATSHNVYVSNVEYATGAPVTGWPPPLLHVLGSNQRRGAFRSYDLGNPAAPSLSGESPGDTPAHYTHDATSMVVDDARATACGNSAKPCEILFDFSESTFDLWDFSDQTNPRLLSSTPYDQASYVHSGWWSEDRNFLFVHDELDEANHGLNTTLRIFDLSSLTAPVLSSVWEGPTAAIDHNGYVRGNRYYMSNYTRGFTVLDITEPDAPREVGFFDTYPVSDFAVFDGAWGVYPYLPSGSLLVSDFSGGLYVLADRTLASGHGQIAFTAPAFGGEEGTDAVVSVSRGGGSTGSVSVDYTVFGASANSGDLSVAKGTLEWPGGNSDNRAITVPLSSDAVSEPIERAFVRLANPTGGAVLGNVNLASLFIGDAGASAALQFSEPVTAVRASAERAIVTVRRLGSPLGTVTASFASNPLSAVEGVDYRAPAPRRLRWEDGDARPQTIVVDLVENDVTDPSRRFQVQLSSPAGAVLAGNVHSAVEIRRLPPVTGFVLVDSERDVDIAAIEGGETIDVRLSATDSLSIRAEVENVDWLGSVQLELAGTHEASQIDDQAPYTLFGDDGQGDYEGRSLEDGSYEIRATPFWERGAKGEAGAPLTLSFSITGVADAPLGRVDGVRVAAVVEGLTVSWYAAPGADGYRVQWRTGTESFSVDRQHVLGGGKVTEYTIESLEAGTEYHVRVIATRIGVADAEPSGEAQGTPRAQPPAQVTGVQLVEEVESLAVSWNAVADADGYKVWWRPTADPLIPQRQEIIEGGAAASFTIVGVTAGTEYGVQVIATKAHANDGPPSVIVNGVPRAVGQGPSIDDRTIAAGRVLELDVTDNFRDPEQRALTYSIAAADAEVVEATVGEEGLVAVRGLVSGQTTVTVTATAGSEDGGDWRVSQSFVVTVRGRALVPLFPQASDAVRQGFVRVINRSAESGEVRIAAIDDAGRRYPPVTLSIDAGAAAHFNSNDLEDGNAGKRLSDGIGFGTGDWRLELDSGLELEVLAYVRTQDGFLTAMHDLAPLSVDVHRVPTFNPASNARQVSVLRLVNPGGADTVVTVRGTDDAGASPGGGVKLSVPAGQSAEFTAAELETGEPAAGRSDQGAILRGALGDGAGKWQLAVESEREIVVISLLRSPTGHLTNLSTAPARVRE